MDFCLLQKNMGTYAAKVAKNLSSKYGQKLLERPKIQQQMQ